MKGKILIVTILLSTSAIGQTNPWWEHTNAPIDGLFLSYDFGSDGLMSAVDTATDCVYLSGVNAFLDSSTKLILRYDSNGYVVIAQYLGADAIHDMQMYRGDLYVASSGTVIRDTFGITLAGGVILRFDGLSWDDAGIQQIDDQVWGLDVVDDTLYMGGQFQTINGAANRHAARFDGENWTDIPNNPFGQMPNYEHVACFAKYNDKLYMGGLSPDVNDQDLLVYEDGEWSQVGPGIPGLFTVIRQLQVFNEELYIGGQIIQAEGNPSNGIIRWDGTDFMGLDGGINTSEIFDLEVFEDALIVSGAFSMAGNLAVNGIARWDGAQWCALRTETPGQIIQGMFVLNDSLYSYLAYSDSDLFFQHGFFEIYKWVGGDDFGPCSIPTGMRDELSKEFALYPNPSSGVFRISTREQISKIEVYDSSARLIYYYASDLIDNTLDLTDEPNGLYILKIETENGINFARLMKITQ